MTTDEPPKEGETPDAQPATALESLVQAYGPSSVPVAPEAMVLAYGPPPPAARVEERASLDVSAPASIPPIALAPPKAEAVSAGLSWPVTLVLALALCVATYLFVSWLR